MATASIAHTARAALVAAIDTGALADKVYYGWPGPEGDSQSELAWIDGIIDWTSPIATMKAGRRHRQEEFTMVLIVLTSASEEDSQGLDTVFQRLLVLVKVVEDALADDTTLGESAIQWAEITDIESTDQPYDKGWISRAVVQIRVHARLT